MKLLLGILVSALFLYLAFKDIRPAQLAEALEGLDFWMALPLVALAGLFLALKTWRWQVLLRPLFRAKFGTLAPPVLIGTAVNYLIFGYLGEIVRAYLLDKRARKGKTAIFATIVSERLLDVGALLFFLAAGALFSGLAERESLRAGYLLSLIGAAGLAAIALLAYFSRPGAEAARKLSARLSSHAAAKVEGYLQAALSGFSSLKSPPLLLLSVALSLLLWLLMAACNFCALLAAGIEAPFHAVFLTMALIVLGVTLPNSPGHLGVIEFCYVVSLRPYGVDPTQAAAAGLFFHFFLYLPVILGSLLLSRLLGFTLFEVKKEAESEFEA